MDRERVVVASILRTRGIRGEVVALSQTDIPGRLESLQSASLQLADGTDCPVEIESAWPHKGDWILKFRGVDSIEAAEKFKRADLWVPFESRGELATGDFFESDLLGCALIDAATEARLGTIEGWQRYGGPPLMEVVEAGRERLIPFVAALCEVDLSNRTIRMAVPEGLLDL